MSTLDQIAISIELTLISVIEGLALQSLAGSALPVLHDGGMWMFVPYILAGLLFLLVFWAQSILHAVSFIRWPIRIGHMLLYFLAAFVQVIIYGNISDPAHWFFWSAVFSAIVLATYWLDLRLIHDSKRLFDLLENGREFLAEVEARHLYEFKFLALGAFIFNAVVYFLIATYPQAFIGSAANIFGLGALQTLVSGVGLWDCVRNFAHRTKHIAQIIS